MRRWPVSEKEGFLQGALYFNFSTPIKISSVHPFVSWKLASEYICFSWLLRAFNERNFSLASLANVQTVGSDKRQLFYRQVDTLLTHCQYWPFLFGCSVPLAFLIICFFLFSTLYFNKLLS